MLMLGHVSGTGFTVVGEKKNRYGSWIHEVASSWSEELVHLIKSAEIPVWKAKLIWACSFYILIGERISRSEGGRRK